VAGTYTICLKGTVRTVTPQSKTFKFELFVETDNTAPTWIDNFTSFDAGPLDDAISRIVPASRYSDVDAEDTHNFSASISPVASWFSFEQQRVLY